MTIQFHYPPHSIALFLPEQYVAALSNISMQPFQMFQDLLNLESQPA